MYLAFDRFFIPRLTENFKFKCKSNVKIIVGLFGEFKKKTKKTTFCLRLEKETTCDKCEHMGKLMFIIQRVHRLLFIILI